MSLNIILAHTGDELVADQTPFKSLDTLRSWIAQHGAVPTSRQILMSARGRPVKLQTLLTEREIFVYDRDAFSQSQERPNLKLPQIPFPEEYDPEPAPDTLADEGSLQSWQQLFKDRLNWAVGISQKSDSMVQQIRFYSSQMKLIRRATAIAAENVKQHIGGLHRKHEEAKTWANDTVQGQNAFLEEWKRSSQKYGSVQIHEGVMRFFAGPGLSSRRPSSREKYTLQSLIDEGTCDRIVSRVVAVIEGLGQRMSDLDLAYENVVQDGSELLDRFNQELGASSDDIDESVDGFADEVRVMVQKIQSDYEDVSGNSRNPRSLPAISKTALLHTRNFLPSLTETVIDIYHLLQATVERRNTFGASALTYIQQQSAVESALASLQSQLGALDLSEEDGIPLDELGQMGHLPTVYGSVLAEIIRRREWTDKMSSDSAALAEEIATSKSDEEKRRKKWLKTVAGFIAQDALESRALGIDVILQGEEPDWPKVTRTDLQQYSNALRRAGGLETALKETEESLKALETSMKQPSKRNKAIFKHGSLHNSAFGGNSLLLQGDDELVRSLQNDKVRLEDRLKGSESRIRKLEDLLHRSSQMQRPVSGHGQLPPFERQGASPVLNHASLVSPQDDANSRRSSVSSRRVSANFSQPEKNFLQRIGQLENELIAEKAKSSQMQEVNLGHVRSNNELKQQIEEAASTKKDLMDNFEAQQREFDEERRHTNGEKRKMKARLEELEEELERLLGSQENVRFSAEERARSAEAELDAFRKEAEAEAQKAQARVETLELDVQHIQERASTLNQQAIDRNEAQIFDTQALRSAHQYLGGEDALTGDFRNLVEAVEMLSQKASDQLRETKLALEHTKTENASLGSRLKTKEDDHHLANVKLMTVEREMVSLRQESEANYARAISLDGELDEHRTQLSDLREKLSNGQLGSEALREQLTNGEKRLEDALLELATARSEAEQSNLKLVQQSDALESLEKSGHSLASRLQDRAHRAAEISFGLFLQTDRLTRLLEHIGYLVTRNEDGMIVQRIPRTSTKDSSALIDQSQSVSITKTPSAPYPEKFSGVPPDYLHWPMAEDADKERRDYETFVHESHAFDMDAFAEAVVKRVKEADHTARKWQREAKSYRDKFHRAQSEAQHKIAFRSFREGDLALFLPTRNPTPKRSWAAFNVGAPHYFLNEQDLHKLKSRDYLLARISRIEERVVGVSRRIEEPSSKDTSGEGDESTNKTEKDEAKSIDEDNPFGLSDGLRWYLLDAAEEKLGAPTTPGLGKTTVASAHIDAAGSIQQKKDIEEGLGRNSSTATRTLAKSLDSRRSSTNSKKSQSGTPTTALQQQPQLSSSPSKPLPAAATPPPSRLESQISNGIQVTDEVLHGQLDNVPAASIAASLLRSANNTPSHSPAKSSSMAQSPPQRSWEALWGLDLNLEGEGR